MTGALVTVKDLRKSFITPAGELQVLKGIDMSVGDGEMVSIVGASGAGKSTLLHILGTLDTPTKGTVSYNLDGPVNPFTLGSDEVSAFRNSMIGFVFQFHYLLPEFSALENVMMPGLISRSMPKSEKSGNGKYRDIGALTDRAMYLLGILGLEPRKTHKPGELSGGEQQRVAVARALLLEPRIIFADEPTGNLDTATGEALFKELMQINKEIGITFVIVTHNESLSKRCHRTVVMSDGRLLNR
jgi:lipoprotein-releasing system ATP-binding protein